MSAAISKGTFFFIGMPPYGVLPCRWYIARACGHWLSEWLSVCQYQVVRGRPQGLLQWLGAPMTRWWFCLGSAHATCLKNWSYLFRIRWETGWHGHAGRETAPMVSSFFHVVRYNGHKTVVCLCVDSKAAGSIDAAWVNKIAGLAWKRV